MRHSRIAFSFLIGSLLLSIYFFIFVWGGYGIPFDTWSQIIISQLFGKETHLFFEIISELGTKKGIGVVAILFITWLWWKEKDYTGIAVFVLAVGFGNEVNKFIKNLVGRERPITAPAEDLMSLSFPSGHAMVGMILYLLIAYFLINQTRKNSTKILIALGLGTLVFLVGISRNVLLAHFPSDVLGGYALGFIWGYVWIMIYELVKKRKTT